MTGVGPRPWWPGLYTDWDGSYLYVRMSVCMYESDAPWAIIESPGFMPATINIVFIRSGQVAGCLRGASESGFGGGLLVRSWPCVTYCVVIILTKDFGTKKKRHYHNGSKTGFGFRLFARELT